MAKYVDGFVFVVPKDKVDQYKEMAEMGRNTWMKHGALDYKECMGEDLQPEAPEGAEGMKGLTFPELTKAGSDETVWFSFIVFESKAHRDEVNAKVMKDPQMSPEAWKDKPMPFEMQRMSYGGFEVVVDA